MENNKSMAVHYFLRGVILFAFALFIVLLVRTDSMYYYIAPRMMFYVKLSAMGLYAISVYQLFLGFKALSGKIELCECQNMPSRSIFKNTIVYGLFIVPLLLGFLMPNVVIGSAMAAKKGVNLNSASLVRSSDPATNNRKIEVSIVEEPAQKQNMSKSNNSDFSQLTDEELEALFEYDIFTEFYAKFGMQLYKNSVIMIEEETYIESLTTIDLFLDTFVGRELQISGFIFREDNLSDQQFVIARFAMQCCAADAMPFGVLVESDHANSYAKDEWVRIRGTLTKTEFNGYEIMLIEADSIERITEPASPYVYPNYDIGF